MPDPYSPDIDLQQCLDHCSVETIANGHVAIFIDSRASFVASNGPNEWTEMMAKKAAVFFWCLKQREQEFL